VISPILANIYLHEVLDTWFAEEVKPLLTGKASMASPAKLSARSEAFGGLKRKSAYVC